jgi:hypothetical protein
MRFRISAGLGAKMALPAVCVMAASIFFPVAEQRPVVFASAQELKALVERNGLCCNWGGSDSGFAGLTNFYVTRYPVTRAQLPATKRTCGQTSDWSGVVWVTQIRQNNCVFCIDSISGCKRVWGNVLVAGDEEVMDAIEEIYRSP